MRLSIAYNIKEIGKFLEALWKWLSTHSKINGVVTKQKRKGFVATSRDFKGLFNAVVAHDRHSDARSSALSYNIKY